MHSAVDVARGILTNAAKQGVALSDADLHRLAVHAQAWFGALRERPLFEEPIVAEVDGPVVPAIRIARRNGGIACFDDDDEAYRVLGEYAYWQTSAVVIDHIAPLLSADEINAEVDAVAGQTAPGCEVDREALSCRVRDEIDRRRGPPPDPAAALRRLDEDPNLLQRLIRKAEQPTAGGIRPR